MGSAYRRILIFQVQLIHKFSQNDSLFPFYLKVTKMFWSSGNYIYNSLVRYIKEIGKYFLTMGFLGYERILVPKERKFIAPAVCPVS